jgi:hypothetical protein
MLSCSQMLMQYCARGKALRQAEILPQLKEIGLF